MTARLRKWLILAHRYLGIVLALLFFVWFVSGIAMIYARDMPRLTPQTRLARLPPLDLTRVRVTPWQAAERADLARSPARITLLIIQGRPAYRFAGARPTTVFADSGELMPPAGERESVAIAAAFMSVPPSSVHHARSMDRADQWTIAQRRQLPLHKFSIDDESGTELYVSPQLGEVVVQTTRASRALAWIAAIPHWLYFAPLRLNDALWRQVILWTSGLGTVSVAIGLVLAVLQLRTTYRGWLRWHYVTGVAFGVFTLAWVFSGMLSMEPWFWAASDRPGPSTTAALTGGTLDVSAFPAIEASAWNAAIGGRRVKEIEYRWIQGAPYYLARSVEGESLLAAQPLSVRSQPFETRDLLDRIARANTDTRIVEYTTLSDYDDYYYDRDRQAPLPVLRVLFDDPDSTWVYVDPRLSAVVARFTRRERLQRWLYHGLHSLDFPFWYYSRVWDVAMIALLSGGATLSAIGVFIGWRRVRLIVST